jgi:uncharacterized protein YndB with AHSA1/START domain
MKWLLYLLAGGIGLLLLAVVILLAIGMRPGAGRFETSIEIARPAPVVFSWITEPDRVKSWIGWMIEIRSLTPGQTGVGTREVWVMEDRNNNNQRMDIEVETTRVDPNRALEASLKAAMGFTGRVAYELEPLDANRTRLTYTASFDYANWLARLMEPLISRSAGQKLQEDLERLKQKAEAE